jgi:hypothetical protein
MTILTRNNQCLELRGTGRRRRRLGMALSGEEGDNKNSQKERSKGTFEWRSWQSILRGPNPSVKGLARRAAKA